MSKTQKQLENSKGRFVTVATKDGRVFCAKHLKTTPCYVNIYDVNEKRNVKLHKASLV